MVLVGRLYLCDGTNFTISNGILQLIQISHAQVISKNNLSLSAISAFADFA
jgi:hypothetical protein